MIISRSQIPERREYKKLWYLKNRERILEERKEYYQENCEDIKVRVKEYGRSNREKCTERDRAWKKNNRERYLERSRKDAKKWRESNPDKFKKVHKKWRARNKAIVNFWNKRRQIRKRGAMGSHTLEEWNELKKQCNYICFICNKVEPQIKLTEDHIIPLSRKGTDYIENIQPLCRSCNSKKGVKLDN